MFDVGAIVGSSVTVPENLAVDPYGKEFSSAVAYITRWSITHGSGQDCRPLSTGGFPVTCLSEGLMLPIYQLQR